ncbi:MAG TPA: pyridoxamine 5'-phosphate oxidase [Pyrinomonadaceae bacterium]|jgi:pyridoxamine 5'-phosphate oxidase|nr:pyridoxamine 5'-phosphate oxidase [Pyrinomonadaceae bacterium]
MERDSLAQLRRDYASSTLDESNVAADPLDQFRVWLDDALKADVLDPNALTLATCGSDCRPSARVVLLKYYSEEGFTFFTNYESRKGRELTENPNATMHFFWPQLHRQIMIEGSVEKYDRDASDAYFLSRPLDSRIGAWASHQSAAIESREVLNERVKKLTEEFGEDVPPPPFWGGFTLLPDSYEFWQGRVGRLHDRIVYTRDDDRWEITRLAP